MRKPSKSRIKRYADRIVGSDSVEKMLKLTAASSCAHRRDTKPTNPRMGLGTKQEKPRAVSC
jgi:hypothetical protein